MKLLILFSAIMFTGCFTTRHTIAPRKVNTYKCTRELIGMKVNAETAIEFCQGTFREDLSEF